VILIGLAIVGVVGFVIAPRLGFALARAAKPARAAMLPWLSAGLFVVSWLLPNPAMEGTATFTQHAVGGGAACAVAGLYIALNAGLRSSILRVVFAYAVAASLGTAVELLELVYDQTQGTHLTRDSSWDLLANSTGAVITALALEAGLRLSSRQGIRR
jgi:hypothetical protein